MPQSTLTTLLVDPASTVPSRNSLQPSRPSSRETDESFLTPNASPLGTEPVNNPPHWPDHEHRRVPPFRRPATNPDWNAIAGDSFALRMFFTVMVHGCQIEQV
ncbi:hypothetical protein BAUCODRAFT_572883 [Baudoinia panamericana UAMH 10762]|uniref:Uncharacterized protein n=1 Tax=Baudoinia panamericana (strain UAMH 10762) TaxID=717646 RepID=M2N443_BAUPA|nr:uncharacterized protein BAUCODRAFT_572883 [Baudoinia panamericana UAMH 10762]EMC98758.1 hypothetical protein BAUCODRAFT_572883 [Baudoinia panamericana UAMH 10762]